MFVISLSVTAVEKHTDFAWIRLYVKRWLTAPMQMLDGTQMPRDKGTPQGGVISPILANLFLYYEFERWLANHYPDVVWCRYAYDVLLHCKSEAQAVALLQAIWQRFEQFSLELHPMKTKIVYCKDGRRTKCYRNTSFEFLGYSFRLRGCWSEKGQRMILGFTPEVSPSSLKAMRTKIRKSRLRERNDLSLAELAGWLNPVMRGWLAYYDKYTRSAMYAIVGHVNKSLVRWVT